MVYLKKIGQYTFSLTNQLNIVGNDIYFIQIHQIEITAKCSAYMVYSLSLITIVAYGLLMKDIPHVMECIW